MKGFVTILVVGVIFAVMVELFCSNSGQKKVLFSVLSLIVMYLSISSVKTLIKDGVIDTKLEINLGMEESLTKIAESRVNYTSSLIESAVYNEGLGEIEVLDVSFKVNEYDVVFDGVVIKRNSEYTNEDKVKDVIHSIIPTIEKENVVIIWKT